jgi:hypothetical protein
MELWNCIALLPKMFSKLYDDSVESNLLDAIWVWDFKNARDQRPSDVLIWRQIKTVILYGEWNVAVGQIETLVQFLDRYKTAASFDYSAGLVEAFNNRFEKYLVGLRFIGHEITPIDSLAAAEAVSGALAEVSLVDGARYHLQHAVKLLSDREKPDFPNSIKESISAVESTVKKVTGVGTLGEGLKMLESHGLTIHPALKDAWRKMYGWTSSQDGIRHGGINPADSNQELAKYVLVTCSAFISYLMESGRKAGVFDK